MRTVIIIGVLLANVCSASAHAATFDWGVNLADQDRSVRPGDDFAMYENGTWFKQTTLTPQQANAAYWRDLRIDAGKRVNQMLGDLASSSRQLSEVEAMVADFRRSMDSDAIDRAGLAPLQPEFRAIKSANNRIEFARLMGFIEGPNTVRQPTVRAAPGRDFFSLAIDVDRQNPSRYALYV